MGPRKGVCARLYVMILKFHLRFRRVWALRTGYSGVCVPPRKGAFCVCAAAYERFRRVWAPREGVFGGYGPRVRAISACMGPGVRAFLAGMRPRKGVFGVCTRLYVMILIFHLSFRHVWALRTGYFGV